MYRDPLPPPSDDQQSTDPNYNVENIDPEQTVAPEQDATVLNDATECTELEQTIAPGQTAFNANDIAESSETLSETAPTDAANEIIRQIEEPYLQENSDDLVIEEDSNGGRPRVNIANSDMFLTVRAAYRLLIRLNHSSKHFRFFMQGGRAVEAYTDAQGRLIIKQLTPHLIRKRLGEAAIWHKGVSQEDGSLMMTDPPYDSAKAMLDEIEFPYPCIKRIVRAPIFDQHGRLTRKAGYDPVTGCYLHLPDDAQLFEVDKIVTPESLRNAVSWFEDISQDFPWKDRASRTHVIAAIVQHFAREMINGATPAYMIWKHAPGTGASLLADVISLITNGTKASPMTEGKSKADWQKRITAGLRQTPPMMFFDNISKRIDSDALASALTSTQITDRLLGKSQVVELPNNTLWVFTANNPNIADEIADRSVSIGMDAQVGRPQDRVPEGGWKYPDLLDFIAKNRWTFVWAACTLTQNYLNRLDEGYVYTGRRLNRFGPWSNVMGGIMECAGIPDFLANRNDFLQTVDEETEMFTLLVHTWAEKFGGKNVGARELLEIVDDLEMDIDLGNTDQQRRQGLGYRLKQLTGRKFGIYTIRRMPNGAGSGKFRLVWDERAETDAIEPQDDSTGQDQSPAQGDPDELLG